MEGRGSRDASSRLVVREGQEEEGEGGLACVRACVVRTTSILRRRFNSSRRPSSVRPFVRSGEETRGPASRARKRAGFEQRAASASAPSFSPSASPRLLPCLQPRLAACRRRFNSGFTRRQPRDTHTRPHTSPSPRTSRASKREQPHGIAWPRSRKE